MWKKFHLGELHDSLRDLVPATLRKVLGRGPRPDQLAEGDFWALRDVSFEATWGSALGIIGPNGAGKSTMLKLLTRILRPTLGCCEVHGRVGSLIEIAAGFHPDLTGRENVFLQGVIMGMRRTDVARRLDEIVEFAGVGPFIDTPVKRYSSGMHARLGFSVAAHLEPDVLLIDEVLSVGDMSFQDKCIERMKEFKRRGVAIVFVSHNLQAVAGLCDRALYLHSDVRAYGPTSSVLEQYVASSEAPCAATSNSLSIVAARLLGGHAATRVAPGTPLTVRVTFVAHESLSDLTLGFLLHRSTDGLTVYDGSFPCGEFGLDRLSKGQRVTIDFRFRAHVTRGQYHVEVLACHNPSQMFLARFSPVALLTVEESRTFAGVADLEVTCKVVERPSGDALDGSSLDRSSPVQSPTSTAGP